MTERDIFIAALQKEDGAERRAYLDEACAQRLELRQQVEHLLGLYEGAGSFLEKPAAESSATGAFPNTAERDHSPEAAGAVIGPYKLLEQIGEGGMGTVWMAQQTEPVKRLVALKLIKAGMDSKQVIARFEAERQALALMDHANIARVLDAGATSAGRPYFVMDLVKGAPITKYCDEHHLTPRQRLELFIPVCQAVQHAHQKGIIHRDLKPSNVLVALYDGRPVPKVIDFGVAKAAGQPLTEKTLVTGFGNIVGTLEYMSPEQAEINQLDIDTRSDIYSLGVLLYELLTGSPPFTRKELEKAGVLEMLRVIREREPTKPSTKLSTAEGLPTLAANRGTEPAKLTKLVRGELDWIVMKALEKDRNRRYETANAFAMDVQRYLVDEPVQAGPPSATYRLRKFIRRNKGPVLAVSLVVLALVGGIIGTTSGMILATDEATERGKAETQALKDRDLAEKAEKEAHKDRDLAEKAEKRAKQDRDDAIAQRNRAFDQQYALGMSPLSRLWREGSHIEVRQVLNALRPGPGETDLRGFEWHYQDRLSRGALRTLKGHYDRHMIDTVKGMAFSPDGRWLASGGGQDQGELFLWDAATGQEVRRFHGQGHKLSSVSRVAFSPDGKTLASDDHVGNAVRLWDVASGKLLHSLPIDVREHGSLAFSPDGQTIAAAGYSIVKLWEVSSGQELGKWKSESVVLVAFHPEGLLTVTRSAVTLHEPATGKELRSYPHDFPLSRTVDDESAAAPAVSPDGSRVAVAAPNGIWLLNVSNGEKRHFLKEHTREKTNGLCFSPDGLRLASAGKDGAVHLFDTKASAHVNTIRVFEEGVARVAFSLDGLRLAVAGRDGVIHIWDAGASGEASRTFRGLDVGIGFRRVAFTPDGAHFVVLPYLPRGPHEMPYLCDAVSGQKTPGQSGGKGPLAYSADGRWLAAGCKEGIRVWDAVTSREVRTISTTDPCGRLAFVGSGRFVSNLEGREGNTTVQLWDAASGRVLATLKGQVLSPDGRRLAARDGPTQLKMWDIDKGRMEDNVPVTCQSYTKTFTGFTFSPDGTMLATSGQDKDQGWSVKLWDAATLKLVRSIPWAKEQIFGGVTFSADGRFLAASDGSLIKVWEVTGREVFTSEGKEQGGSLTLSPDGGHLAATRGGRVKVWEVKTGRERFTYQGNERDLTLSFAPNGRYLATLAREFHKVDYFKVWEVSGRQVLNYQRNWGGQIRPRINIAFSPDSSAIAATDIDGANKVWDLATGRERFAIKVGTEPVGIQNIAMIAMYGAGVAFSPDGRQLATGNPSLQFWDAATGAGLHTPGGPAGPVAAMAVSPVGRRLATGQGQVVRLWDLDTWKPLGTFGGHSGDVSTVAFSQDGRLLAAGDGIWDLTNGRKPPEVTPPTRRLDRHPKGIVALAFSPDGQQLFSFGAGTVKIWDVASGQERSSAKFAPEKVGGAVFSPDGKLLACGESNAVRLWDLTKGQEVRVLTVEDKMRRGTTISALAFSPDGRRLAAVGVKLIRIWDMRTFHELYTISQAPHTTGLAFSPDGGRLIAVGGVQVIESRPGSTTGGGLGEGERNVVLYDGRPLTPEGEVEREALGILDQLFNRSMPHKGVLEYLRTSPALSDPVRQAALRLADHYREDPTTKQKK